MSAEEYLVEVQPDFVARQARAQPIAALAELIWNSLDADATEVNVDFDDDGVGGMSKIVVSDNGHGIERSEAPALFRNLGGSWKHASARTKTKGRNLHGQEGRGRFKAFALGAAVDWRVVYSGTDGLKRYDISVLESDMRKVRISDEEIFNAPSTGVTVVIRDLKKNFVSLRSDHAVQELAETFALYLKAYRDVRVCVEGQAVDPSHAIAEQWKFDLSPIVDENGQQHPATLEVIEWRNLTRKFLYLCNEGGFPLSQVDARFHVGDFHFSAYLCSPFFGTLHKEDRLDVAELLPVVAAAVEEARAKIKDLFRQRASERAKVVVDEWKARKLYPYEGEAASQLETAERQIFDIVAVTVQEASNEFKDAQPKQTALHLRMLRHAIERSPAELQKILDEVLKLPKRKQLELASLLDETNLSGIISAAKLVADRLKFLEGLRHILFDYDAKNRIKERSQLHKILEQNTWIFGEEYNLWASDKELTTVLKIHKAKLDPELVIDEPVKIVNKERGIVDLMLSRAQRRNRSDDIEHLVIELKAPKHKITAEHLTQIEGYALAVEEDPRFNRVDGLRWHFWAISDDYDARVSARIKNGPDPRRRLIQKGDRISIGVKTWGEVLEENNARLQFIKEALEHNADEGRALKYLSERHSEFLKGVIVTGEQPEVDDAEAAAE